MTNTRIRSFILAALFSFGAIFGAVETAVTHDYATPVVETPTATPTPDATETATVAPTATETVEVTPTATSTPYDPQAAIREIIDELIRILTNVICDITPDSEICG